MVEIKNISVSFMYRNNKLLNVIFYGDRLVSSNHSTRVSIRIKDKNKGIYYKDKNGNPLYLRYDQYSKLKKKYKELINKLYNKDIDMKYPIDFLIVIYDKGKVKDTLNIPKLYIDLLIGSVIIDDSYKYVHNSLVLQLDKKYIDKHYNIPLSFIGITFNYSIDEYIKIINNVLYLYKVGRYDKIFEFYNVKYSLKDLTIM